LSYSKSTYFQGDSVRGIMSWIPMFEKTCATSQKNAKVICFLDFQKNVKKRKKYVTT